MNNYKVIIVVGNHENSTWYQRKFKENPLKV